MIKPVWSPVLALSAWTLKKAHIVTCLSTDYKHLHARQIPQQLSFPSQTIPDCKRNNIGDFCYKFKSEMNILASF